MLASIIIPTFNGAKKIRVLLAALLVQTVKDFNIVVVVDGSTDNTIEVLEEFSFLFKDLKIVKQINKGRAAARNVGAKVVSEGEIIIFYDDDMEPFPDSVQRHIQFHGQREGLCTGCQREPFESLNSDIQNYKARLSESWLSPYPMGVTRLSLANLFFTTANCSIKRKDFLLLNGFNEDLSDAEDYELAGRAIELGIPVYFDRSNDAWHRELYSLRKLIHRQSQYHRAHIKVQDLHKKWDLRIHPVSKARTVFYWLFSSIWLLNFVESSRWCRFIPRAMRHKIYGWIIYAKAIVFPNRSGGKYEY
jgi:glycosyltransferase involved in cell wall biosynthesis